MCRQRHELDRLPKEGEAATISASARGGARAEKASPISVSVCALKIAQDREGAPFYARRFLRISDDPLAGRKVGVDEHVDKVSPHQPSPLPSLRRRAMAGPDPLSPAWRG